MAKYCSHLVSLTQHCTPSTIGCRGCITQSVTIYTRVWSNLLWFAWWIPRTDNMSKLFQYTLNVHLTALCLYIYWTIGMLPVIPVIKIIALLKMLQWFPGCRNVHVALRLDEVNQFLIAPPWVKFIVDFPILHIVHNGLMRFQSLFMHNQQWIPTEKWYVDIVILYCTGSVMCKGILIQCYMYQIQSSIHVICVLLKPSMLPSFWFSFMHYHVLQYS